MKLIALRNVYGVRKILARAKDAHKSAAKNQALPGDMYEGDESHIGKGFARAVREELAVDVVTDEDAVDVVTDGSSEKDQVNNLKKRCAELGIEEGKYKNLRKAEKILAVIEEFEKSQEEDLGLSE